MASSKKFVPRPYQTRIIDFIISHPRCMVWAGMGMGKTVSTLTALKYLIDFEDAGPALVIAPLRVAKFTWPAEKLHFSSLISIKCSVVCGSLKERKAALKEEADVYITNFEQLPWLVKTLGSSWPFETVVVDEATRLKGFRLRQGSSRAKALATVAHRYCKRFIELTGTPATNGLLDLWGQSWFVDGGKRLGKSFSEYELRYFRPRRVGAEAYAVKWDPLPGSEEAIRQKLSDVSITIRAEDYFDIKKPVESIVWVDLPDEMKKNYDKLRNEFYLAMKQGEIEAANAAVKLGKLLQFSSGAVYEDDGKSWIPIHDLKIDALRSVVEEAAGTPVLVAYQYRHELERILKAFPQARQLDKKSETLEAWNKGDIPILVAHPAACGHGLNLQDGGNILCFFSLGFNYEYFAQMIERIGPTRQAQSGHPRPVFVYYLMCRGTEDHAVLNALRKKESVLDFVLGRANEQKGD